MAIRPGMIKCSNCGRAMEDTFHEYIICVYCGKRTNREEALSTSEEEVRRRLIWDVSDNIRKYKMMRMIGFIIGPLLLLTAFLLLFSNVFTLKIILIFVMALALGCVWLVIAFSANKRSEASMSKMFDFGSDAAD